MSTALVRTGTAALATTRLLPTLLNGGFFVALAGLAYILIKKVLNKINRNSAMKDIGQYTVDGMAATFASQLYNAMFSSFEWWNDWFGDGTDEDAMYQTAAQMKQYNVPMADVARQYKNLYSRDLLSDIQKELSSSEYQKFTRAMQTGLSGFKPVDAELHTTSDGYVLNDRFQPVQAVRPRTRLGMHLETYIFPNGTVYHGFDYRGQMRYISSSTSKIHAKHVPA